MKRLYTRNPARDGWTWLVLGAGLWLRALFMLLFLVFLVMGFLLVLSLVVR